MAGELYLSPKTVRLPGEQRAWLIAGSVLAALLLVSPVTAGASLALLYAVLVSVAISLVLQIIVTARIRAQGVPITPLAYPDICQMEGRCAEKLGLRPGEGYVLYTVADHSRPNAYVAGLTRPYLVVLNSGAREVLANDPVGLTYVLGHELAHCANNDPWKGLLSGVLWQAVAGRWSLAALPARMAFALPQHYLEGAADRAGYLLAVSMGGDIRQVVDTLVRLACSAPHAARIDCAAIVESARQTYGSAWGTLEDALSDHPALGGRIYALCQYAQSLEFQELVGPEESARQRAALEALRLGHLGVSSCQTNPENKS